MSKRAKVILISAVGVVGLLIILFTAVVIYAILSPKPVWDAPSRTSDTPFASSESPSALLLGSGTGLYPTVEEAMEHSAYLQELEEGITDRSGEVFRFEDGDAATVFYFAKNRDGVPLLLGYIFDKDESGYSGPRCRLTDTVNRNDTAVWSYVYEPEDRVAKFIVLQAVQWRGYARASDGLPIYLGVTEDLSAYGLRILGEAPTGVVEAEYDGQAYYIWYYVGTDFRRALIDAPGFTFADYTLAEVIEVLGISFDGEGGAGTQKGARPRGQGPSSGP